MSKPRQNRFVPASGLGWLTPLYDFVVRFATRERAFKRALLARFGGARGAVLDPGCGTGTLALYRMRKPPAAGHGPATRP